MAQTQTSTKMYGHNMKYSNKISFVIHVLNYSEDTEAQLEDEVVRISLFFCIRIILHHDISRE